MNEYEHTKKLIAEIEAKKKATGLPISYHLNNLKTELNWAMFFLDRNNAASAKSYVQLVIESLEDTIEGLKAAKHLPPQTKSEQ